MAEFEPVPKFALDASNLMLIVVGAHLRAEVADRPLAYKLTERIHDWLHTRQPQLGVPVLPVVCTDLWYMNQAVLQTRPTVSLGGPGVNALSAYYAQKLSPAVVRENQMIIQLDPEFVDLRVCLWGMDHQLTIDALKYFIDHYFDGYMRAVVTQVEPKID